MVYFVDSSSNKKLTLTMLDKENDPIEEGMTLPVDMPVAQPFRCSLLDHCLKNSCWSVEFTHDIQCLDGAISYCTLLKLSSQLVASSTPSQETNLALCHCIMDETLS